MTAPEASPTGGCQPTPPAGEHIALVIDQTPLIGRGWTCLKPIAGGQWCHLSPSHHDRCLALPKPWPREDITPDNPNVRDNA